MNCRQIPSINAGVMIRNSSINAADMICNGSTNVRLIISNGSIKAGGMIRNSSINAGGMFRNSSITEPAADNHHTPAVRLYNPSFQAAGNKETNHLPTRALALTLKYQH